MGVFSFGMTGLGGYAGWICDQLLGTKDPSTRDDSVRLAAVFEPDLKANGARAERARRAGVKLVGSYDELLAESVDGIWLPLPIDLHRTFTEKSLKAGKPVLVEKPAAGSVDDVDAMITARNAANVPVAVGFQNLFDASAWATKRELLNGAIGKIQSASVIACWPRSTTYFARTPWAGKLKRGDTWILDSPANNALAHFVNLTLFLLGQTESESAQPTQVEAELYRANKIESYDTCFIRYEVPSGAKLLVAMTHACEKHMGPIITIRGEKGTCTFHNEDRYEITTSAGKKSFPAMKHLTKNIVHGFVNLVRGNNCAHAATLENARAHTVAINGAVEAAPVYDVPHNFITAQPSEDGGQILTIKGIDKAIVGAGEKIALLSELQTAGWSKPAGKKNLINYNHFSGPFGT